MKNIYTTLLLVTVLSVSFNGCSKDFLEENPLAKIAPDNLYVNNAGFEAGLYGVYNLVRAERKGIAGASNDIANTAAVIGGDNA